MRHRDWWVRRLRGHLDQERREAAVLSRTSYIRETSWRSVCSDHVWLAFCFSYGSEASHSHSQDPANLRQQQLSPEVLQCQKAFLSPHPPPPSRHPLQATRELPQIRILAETQMLDRQTLDRQA